jgi:8-oxo-dGTP diphosphatase
VAGLGGRVEQGEEPADAAARAVRDVAGLVVEAAALQRWGTLSWRFPARAESDQVVAVFGATAWEGQETESAEIAPEWWAVDALPLADMGDAARYWLPKMLASQQMDAEVVFAEDGQTVKSVRSTMRVAAKTQGRAGPWRADAVPGQDAMWVRVRDSR